MRRGVELRDTRGVALGAFALEVEEGGSAGYTAALTARPSGTVTLTPSVVGNADVTVTPARLTFTAQNWNLPQTLTVRAAQDADGEDDTAEVRHLVSGADYGANAVTAGAVRVSVRDDDRLVRRARRAPVGRGGGRRDLSGAAAGRASR